MKILAATMIILTAPWSVIAEDESADAKMVAELSAFVRNLIEPRFKADTGFGFTSLVCDPGTDFGPGGRFDCDAVDEEGDRIRYTLAIDDKGTATVVMATQPAADMTAEQRAAVEPPCRKFLEKYSESDWESLIADLHPTLVEQQPPDQIRAQLVPTRESLGAIRSASLQAYAVNTSGRHEVAYSLDCANGPGTARFGLLIEKEGTRISAFVVTAAPGSPLHTELLQIKGHEMIADFVDEPVNRLEAPIDQLMHVGDSVDGTAWLEDGSELRIGVVQQGRHDDFDTIDYRFQVLEVEWLLHRVYTLGQNPATTVECPTRTAPDGGTLTCRVEFVSGKKVEVTVARQSGDHRIVSNQPVD